MYDKARRSKGIEKSKNILRVYHTFLKKRTITEKNIENKHYI